jgi:hypothetical protein
MASAGAGRQVPIYDQPSPGRPPSDCVARCNDEPLRMRRAVPSVIRGCRLRLGEALVEAVEEGRPSGVGGVVLLG